LAIIELERFCRGSKSPAVIGRSAPRGGLQWNAIPTRPFFREICLAPFFSGPEPAFSAAVALDLGNPTGASAELHGPAAAWTRIGLRPNLFLQVSHRVVR
jgi:hypothetical protein